MTKVRLGLVVMALSCAEPSAVYDRPSAPAILELQQDHSYSISSADRSVYVMFTDARSESREPVHSFIRRMFESADSAGATRLVVDVRSVSGSDTFVLVPLLKGVIARDRFLKRGGLLVLVGNDSFSPRQNAATLLQEYANPIIVWGNSYR